MFEVEVKLAAKCLGGTKRVLYYAVLKPVLQETCANAFFTLMVKYVAFLVCFCCFTSHVNSYGHCGTVSSPNHTFFLGRLEQAVNQ